MSARLVGVVLALLAVAGAVRAQVQLALEWHLPRAGIAFGDEIAFDVLRGWPAEAIPEPFDDGALAALAPTLVAVETVDATHERRRYRGRAFAAGDVQLPPLVLRARQPDGRLLSTSHTPPLLVVRSLLGEAPGEVEWPDVFAAAPRQELLPWLLAGVAVVLLGGLWWQRRRPPARPLPVAPEPAAAVARAALARLVPPAAGASRDQVQAYYRQLAAIVRDHAGRGLAVPAATRTSEELCAAAVAGAVALRACLSACDAVKFAAGHPGPGGHAAAHAAALAFVGAEVA